MAMIFSESFRGDFVASDLLADELVIGLVVIESPHDVVSVTPSVAAFKIVCESRRVGVANHIQPVLRHSFTVVRRFQQPIDDLRKGFTI